MGNEGKKVKNPCIRVYPMSLNGTRDEASLRLGRMNGVAPTFSIFLTGRLQYASKIWVVFALFRTVLSKV